MLIKTTYIIIFLIGIHTVCFGQNLQWIENISNVDDDIDIHSMTLSSNGDVFIGGSYDEQVLSDGSSQGVKFGGAQANTTDEQNGFIAKYNSIGVQQWIIDFGSPNSTSGYSPLGMVEDAGFLYVVGSFKHATGSGMDFDPGVGTNYYLSSSTATDFFISKYNTLDGSMVWAYIGSGSAGSDLPSGIDVDVTGNIYVSGYVTNGSSAVDFDIKNGTAPSANGIANKKHLYLLKFDSACNFLWRVNVLNSSDISGGNLVVDRANNFIYLAGGIGEDSGGDPSFSGNTLNVNTTDDAFIVKYDINGNFVWVKNIAESTSSNWVHSIDVDNSGDLFVSGVLQGTADFDPLGTQNRSSVGSYDAFFAKYTSSGAYIWAYSIGSTSFGEGGYSLDVNASGEVLIGGAMYGAADYNPEGTGGAIVKGAAGSRYAYVGVYDTDFKYQWCHAIGNATVSTGNNYIRSVAFDDNATTCALYVFGYHAQSITEDFDPDNAGGNFTATGSDDNGFLAQYGYCPIMLPIELQTFDAFLVDRNVVLNWSTISENNNDFFELQRSFDGVTFETFEILSGAGTSQELIQYSTIDYLPMANLSYYRLKQVDYNGNSSFSAVRAVDFSSNLSINLFPNPATSSLRITNLPKGSIISIYSINGAFIQHVFSSIVDVSKLAEGMYQFVIEGPSSVEVKRFSVKHE